MITLPIEISPPDISAFRAGNMGIPYATCFDSGRPGPHAVITALVHGNELSGAWALVSLFKRKIRPAFGRLSLVFVNTDAFRLFDPESPKRSRYLDQDLNRLWDNRILDGPKRSRELDRAREIRPLIESADYLLDLHSMLQPAEPLLLSGVSRKGRDLARAMGYPRLIIADAGHRNGPRMRDYGVFADPRKLQTAMLVECGQHWTEESVEVAIKACRQFLAAIELVERGVLQRLGPPPSVEPQQVIEVTKTMTVEAGPFRFSRPLKGLDVVPRAGTIIGYDGATPVTTPYDDCVLIMPSQRLTPGATAVRLGRFVDG